MAANETNDSKQVLDKYLESNKLRKSTERYQILDAINSIGRLFTLRELMEELSNNMKFYVSRGTLYNTLRLFEKLNIVTKHNFIGKVYYEAHSSKGSNCYKICTICGKISKVGTFDLVEVTPILHLKQFHKDNILVYVRGTCSACLAKKKRKKTRQTDNGIKKIKGNE